MDEETHCMHYLGSSKLIERAAPKTTRAELICREELKGAQNRTL